jgi:hypothetical protein
MRAEDHAMEAQSRAATEPQMRAAAERRGAVLLPDVVQSFDLPLCPSDPLAEASGPPEKDPRKGCLERRNDAAFNLQVEGARTRLLIPAVYGRDWEAPYGRIARRDNTFVLLVPVPKSRRARGGHACTCFAGGYVIPSDYPIKHVDGFVLDAVEGPIVVERELVWIVVDVIDWRCDSTGI